MVEVRNLYRLHCHYAHNFAGKPETRYTLLFAAAKCTIWENLASLPWRIMLLTLQYKQPILLSNAISFVGQPAGLEVDHREPYELVIRTCLIYFGIAVSSLILFAHCVDQSL